MAMVRWFLRAALHCALLVLLVRPEEVFNTTPPPVRSNFSCYAREPGFYADVQANCRVYHTCDDYGNKFSYRCPEETAFRQDALICDHAHLVDCRATAHSEPPRRPNEKRESLRLGLPSFFKFGSLELGNPRRAFSRSFQVVQRPDKSTPKTHPGFVFSASVFLRDLEEPQSRRNAEGREGNGLRSTLTRPSLEICSANEDRAHSKHRSPPSASSTRPTHPPRQLGLGRTALDPSDNEGPFATRNQRPPLPEGIAKTSAAAKGAPPVTEAPSADLSRSTFANGGDYPYLETLRSIQANARPAPSTTAATASATSASRAAPTTEIPVHALTLSLKPLVPNELEYDPYYPRFPTSTEAYYTPSGGVKASRTSSPRPWASVRFEIPAMLPDLNTLEDLVDRRKLFYIPRLKPA